MTAPVLAFPPPDVLARSWARVCDHVGIGGHAAACDPAVLETLRVRRVLKLYRGRAGYTRHAGVRYRVVDLRDSVDFDAGPHFAPCLDFIRRGAARDEFVLVHCHMGVSRSAAVVLIHLMFDHRLSLAEALGTLRRVHPQACPNPGLSALLAAIDARLAARRASDTESRRVECAK